MPNLDNYFRASIKSQGGSDLFRPRGLHVNHLNGVIVSVGPETKGSFFGGSNVV